MTHWKSRLWLIVLIVLALAGSAGLARWVQVRRGYAELLSVDADVAPSRPQIAAFARAEAPRLYRQACQRCHGADMNGEPRFGAANLTDGDWLYGAGRVSDIEQTITYGIRSGDPRSRNLASMPAFAQPEPYGRYHIPPLKPDEIRDLVEYLRSIEGRPADPAAAARGDQVFHANGGCFDCHGADALGDGAIGAPNLRDNIWLYGDGSRAAVFDSIAHGRAGACPAQIQRLTAGEIRAVALYVQARAAQGRSERP